MTGKIKKILLLSCVPFIAQWLIELLWKTVRCDIVGEQNMAGLWHKGQNIIFVFWHDQMLLLGKVYRGPGVKVLISPSVDGEIIARVMARLGIGSVRGSSSRQGRAALKKMIEISKQSFDIVITPDGPRGPRHKMKPGAGQLARLTKMPVICASLVCSRGHRFSSWDRFLFPYPFSRVVIAFSEPLYSQQAESQESFLQRLEQAMCLNQARAGQLLEEYSVYPV